MCERVVIYPYDPEWPGLFLQLGTELRDALGAVAIRINHIGSTAIPGLAAKPIIDVQVSVASFAPLEAYRAPLCGLGLVFRDYNSDMSKRYFREAPGTRRTHIHVRRAGSWPEQFALLFRDYVREHATDAQAYAALKYRLAEQFGTDRVGYTEAKTSFIWEVMRKADQWAQQTGWSPGASDA